MVWVVSDYGWLFEGRITNSEQALYHGYPMLPNQAFAAEIVERFAARADADGTRMLQAIRVKYGL